MAHRTSSRGWITLPQTDGLINLNWKFEKSEIIEKQKRNMIREKERERERE